MARKAYKYRLYPTKEQEKTLFWTLARCRELYNAALSERRDAYKMAGKSVSYYFAPLLTRSVDALASLQRW